MSRLTIRLLGVPQIEVNGAALAVDTRKAVALLAYLALAGRPQSRHTLAALLWPDSDEPHAQGALRRTLAALNKALGKEWLAADRATIELVEGPSLWLDVARFGQLLEEGRRAAGGEGGDCASALPLLAEAVQLQRGLFLEGFTLYDSAAFDEWQSLQTESLRLGLAEALQLLARCHALLGENEAAIGPARRWLALDPLHEPAHQELMRLYAWSGNRSAMARQFEECSRLLKEELGVQPEPETVALYEHLMRGEVEAPAARTAAAAPAKPEKPTGRAQGPAPRLPRPLTSFVGREEELGELEALLDNPQCRLVTVVGPGGIGKTRLALEVAGRRKERYAHGVHFVPLAAVSSADYLVSAVADALKLSFYGGQGRGDDMDQLLNYLREKELLLVLDNFEHLLDGAQLLANILQASGPGVQLLITSQERLNLLEEWLLEIRGLRCPNGDTAAVAASPAVQLFVQRAGQVAAGFAFSPAEWPHVVHICQLVGGMPLGIEMASTWVRVLSCQEIARQIETSLDFLATTLRNVPERHRSLRAVFEHSWQLLSDQERAAFHKLSVFQGGFRAPAAEEVTGAGLGLLLALADKSLLRMTRGGRYELPQVLRQYAAEKAAADPDGPADREEMAARHCHYYAGFLQEREASLQAEEQSRALAEIREEIENVRQAWRWALAHDDLVAADALLEPLFRFYETRGWFYEGVERFGRAAAALAARAGDARLLGRLLSCQGRLQVRLALLEQGRQTLERSLELLRGQAAQLELAPVLSVLGVVAEAAGDHQTAGDLQQQSLAIYQEFGDRRGVASVLLRLGNRAYTLGDYAKAQDYYRQSLALQRERGDRRGVALCLNNLGSVAEALGEYEEARRLYLESVAIKHEVGDRRGVAYSLNNLGYVGYLLGKYDAAQDDLEECLTIFRELGDRKGLGYALTNLGNVAYGQGDYGEARELYTKSLAVCREINYRLGAAHALNHLGNTSRAAADFAEARGCYREAIEMALAIQATPVLLEVLIEVAALLAAEREWAWAAALLAAVRAHPSSPKQAYAKAEALLPEAAAALGPEALAAAESRGRSLDLAELALGWPAGP